MAVAVLWLRQDLRVSDNPALLAAIATGAVLPVYILDDEAPGAWRMGDAQRWWLHHSLDALGQSLKKRGNRLILRRGRAASELRRIVGETGALSIHAIHHYEPWHKRSEREIERQMPLVLHDGNYLAPPSAILNGQGQRYRVFTPWYRKLLESMSPGHPVPAPDFIPSPADDLVASDNLHDWALLPRDPDWSTGFAEWRPGEKGAWRALRDFLPKIADYRDRRDFPATVATSRLSPHMHFGEISARTLWHAIEDCQGAGAASFRSEVGWREYGTNLIDQMPGYGEENGRASFDRLTWREGAEAERDYQAWTRGRTGYPVVDAGMRELWRTGWMHNRVRMICASFLVKHLLIDWRRGERWFWDTLLDADFGANSMNWQYVAGTGVDAPVFSRIMSPRLQSEKFNMADYIRAFVPEIAHLSEKELYQAHLTGANVHAYPQPLISHDAARARALSAWQAL